MTAARRSDPESSHEAVPESQSISAVQERVMFLLHQYGPMHDRALISRYRSYYPLPEQWASDQSIRSRRSELCHPKHGQPRVRFTGDWVWLPGKKRDRRHRIWEVAA